jgi:hypothetical protein
MTPSEALAERTALREAAERCPHREPAGPAPADGAGCGCGCVGFCAAGRGRLALVAATGAVRRVVDLADCARCPLLPPAADARP